MLESIFKSEKRQLETKCLLACLPACLILTNKFSVWAYWKLFCHLISLGYPLDGLSKSFDKTMRVNIIQFCSISVSFGSMFFFLFQNLDVRASENLSDSWLFNWISCNKGLKAKMSCFFCLTPLRLICSGIRKTTLFLTSHRLKKYKNLHPQSFKNGAKIW